MVTVSSRLMPTSDKATIKLGDVTAIPGQGFSRASANNWLDIFPPLINYTVYFAYRMGRGSVKCRDSQARVHAARPRDFGPGARYAVECSTGERDRICLRNEQCSWV
jgi:hypothetical protein